jgi:hypothetical protein
MASKENGQLTENEHHPAQQASLSAVQALIGAIGARETSVVRFVLGEYEVFLFAARRRSVPIAESARAGVDRTARRRFQGLPTADEVTAVSLDSIVTATCRLLNVSRPGLRSKARSRPLALARALIAHHASRSRVATVSGVATGLKLKNKNSLYVGMARYRKLIPEIFNMPLERFVDATLEPPERLAALLRRKSSKLIARGTTTSDLEIGQRIAHGLPREEN